MVDDGGDHCNDDDDDENDGDDDDNDIALHTQQPGPHLSMTVTSSPRRCIMSN
jgi:hypothetical protein